MVLLQAGLMLQPSQPSVVLVLWLATRIARRSFASYLALRWPSLREIAFAFALTIGLLTVLGVVARLLGYPVSPEFALTSVRTSEATSARTVMGSTPVAVLSSAASSATFSS